MDAKYLEAYSLFLLLEKSWIMREELRKRPVISYTVRANRLAAVKRNIESIEEMLFDLISMEEVMAAIYY